MTENTDDKEEGFRDSMKQAADLVSKSKFNEAIDIYTELIPVAEEMNWTDKVELINDLIKETHEKEKKTSAVTQKKAAVLDKKKREKDTYDNALDLMGQASDSLSKKKFDDAMRLYKESLALLKQINATHEIEAVEESMKQVEVKLKEAKKSEEVIRKSKLKEQRTTEALTQPVAKKEKPETAAKKGTSAIQQKKAKENAIVEEAMNLLDKANEGLKEAKSMNFVTVNAKKDRYNEVIQCYDEAIAKFEEVGWKDEAKKVEDTLKTVKQERDSGVAALAKKLAKAKQKAIIAEEPMVSEPSEEVETRVDALSSEIMQKKVEQKQKRDTAFAALDEAGKALEDFEKKPKIIGGQMFKDNEYPEIIRLYQKALDLFKDADWLDEAVKIEESIGIIEKKEKDFLAEKNAFDKSQGTKARVEKAKTKEMDERQAAALKRLKRDSVVAGKIESKQKQARAIRDEIDQALDKALNHFKKNELKLAEQKYNEARELMLKQGWTKEAENVLDTITMIQEKQAQREKKLAKIERSVDDSGKFTRGVEQISETMNMVNVQEKQQSKAMKKAVVDKKNEQKQREEEFLDILAKAQDCLNNKDYDAATEGFNNALQIAEELNWASQVRDIRDFIKDAEQKRRVEEERASKIEQKRQEAEESSEMARTSAPDLAKKSKAKKLAMTTKQLEKQEGDEAYALIDEGNRLLKSEKRDEAIEQFQAALEKFEKIKWTREAEAVSQQIDKVNKEITDEQAHVAKEQESQKTQTAYDAINEAERFLRNKQPEKSIESYEQAIEIFDAASWTKEADMIRAQIEKINEDLAKRMVADTAGSEQAKADKAFALIDEAKRYQQDKKIFKAVELANQALDVFKGLGTKWSRETSQVQKLVAELDREKKRKEELIKKLKSGEL
ncbi:MAG TPA: hypothetical protein VKM55_12130 [Candidatus Lokiarchaeia archaeon]|nr:hypothetical protein [Candidatus Lokiarchaeia archaeon]